MNGFVTESVNKIADGFGSAVKLLLVAVLTSLAFIPIKTYLGSLGIIGLLILFLILAGIYLRRSVDEHVDERTTAWCGMLAGALFWQVTRFLPEIPGLEWFSMAGLAYWAGASLLTLVLWKKVLSTGIRFLLVTFLLNWIGWLYAFYYQRASIWPDVVASVFQSLHYLGILGVLASIWWIVTRSRNSIERRYGALALYFSVLFSFLIF